ncbi:unnamed protein product [Larinioides sclopetarius]|uniref:Uncharacterized protein n=1 Tax=Larinioides sclopetarius TaxID=280406 RepID=A0AAV1ZKZ9_9ARAC
MIGDALPIRFSRRINKKTSLLPVRVSPKRKLRRSTVKKRTSGVNFSVLKAKEKTKIGGRNKLNKNSNLASKIFQRASCSLKSVARNSSQISIPNICDGKRKTRNSLKTSQVNLTNNKVSLKNIELFDNSKKDIKKKNCKKFLNEEKQYIRKSSRLSKSSSAVKEKGKNKELNVCDLKSSKKTGLIQKKNAKQVTTLSSESILTPNPEKCTHITKFSGRKKSAKLSTEPRNQKICVHTPASKLFAVTPDPGKLTRISRYSRNRKSGKLSKESNRSGIIMNSKVSFHANSFHSLHETPQPEKSSEKRKSSRLLEPSPLRTLNKELPFSTPASQITKNPNSTLNKSSKSYKSIDPLSSESHCRKQSRPKVSNKDSSTFSQEKQKRQVNQHQNTSENFKKSLANETENLPLDILTTPAFKPPSGRNLPKKKLSKSDSKSSKRKLNASVSESQVPSEELLDVKKRKSADFPKVPTKGTLKHKRWLLNNLKEKNGSYEDDIFENQNFDLYKPAFHFGDESDGSSVNIATPKFDCILTPALPKKTPRFKDCISPTEFLQARKTAEEYLYRRNKKRKSGDRVSSAKKTSVKKRNTVQDIPEKKKLDFEEAVNKLIAVQKDLEIEAEVDDEEEDSYFSDGSN